MRRDQFGPNNPFGPFDNALKAVQAQRVSITAIDVQGREIIVNEVTIVIEVGGMTTEWNASRTFGSSAGGMQNTELKKPKVGTTKGGRAKRKIEVVDSGDTDT